LDWLEREMKQDFLAFGLCTAPIRVIAPFSAFNLKAGDVLRIGAVPLLRLSSTFY
jgi:hypothetical protein